MPFIGNSFYCRDVWKTEIDSIPKLMYFLDENYKKESLARIQSSIMQELENMSEQLLSCLSHLREDPDDGNDWIFSPFRKSCVSKAKITDDF